MKKKVLSLLLTLAMIVTMLPMEVVAEGLPEEVKSVTEAETGLIQDESGVYQINGNEDWALFCEMLAEGYSFEGETVSLKTNVSLDKPADAFNGTFLGNGNTISLVIDESNSDIGAFKSTDGAVIKNLHVEGSVKGNDNVGGIVGTANDTTFENCIANVTVQAQGANAGGIAGYAAGKSIFSNCLNKGDISGTGNVNGIVGYAEDTVQVVNCDNTGLIEIIEEETAVETPEETESTEAGKLKTDESDVQPVGDSLNSEELAIDESALAAEMQPEEAEEGEENLTPIKGDVLKSLGIDPNLTVYPLTSRSRGISAGIYTITQNVINGREAYIDDDVTIILPDDLTLTFHYGLQIRSGKSLVITTPDKATKHNGTLVANGWEKHPGIGGWEDDLGTGFLTINSGIIKADSTTDKTMQGAGIETETLTINGGTVEAKGAANCAGIGGSDGNSGMKVIINNGIVTATGGENGAGIGGGQKMGARNVIINGGTVTAQGGANAAGIGGGGLANNAVFDPNVDSITINDGTVTARGGVYGAGIGGGNDGDCCTVNINGGTINAYGGEKAAGIGGGDRAGKAGNVNINGGEVTAAGGDYGTGIGTGAGGVGGTITILNGTVTAQGGYDAAGIGGSSKGHADSIVIKGGDVTATGGRTSLNYNGGAGIGTGNESSGGTVIISGGTVKAQGGTYSAGIGGGYKSHCDSIIIEGGDVTAIGGGVYRILSGSGGAGIGIGGTGFSIDAGSNGGEVIIRGGTVTAIGGARSFFDAGGAGIGGSGDFHCDKVIIEGGTVTAIGGLGAGSIDKIGRGSLQLNPDLDVIDLSREHIPTRIVNPTPQKIAGVKKVLIGKIVLEPQTVIERVLTYNDQEQTGYPHPVEHVIPSGIFTATDAGNYTFTLHPQPGYIWADGTDEKKTYNWSIHPAKATVRANNLAITYGDKEPELTATVRGTFGSDQLNYQITREPGKDVGRYTITPSEDEVQVEGNYVVSYQNGTLTIRPKNVSAIRESVFQTIEEGSGSFTEPTFLDKSLGEDITGKLTYVFQRRQMTKEELENTLGGLPAGSTGTITWSYAASGNFTGTITGRIDFRIVRTAHTHRLVYTVRNNQITAVCRDKDCPLSKDGVKLTLNVPENLSYDGNAKEVRYSDGEAEAWKAAMGKAAPSITYSADRGSALTGGKPVNAGSYTASINVNGKWVRVRFAISKLEYTDVNKEAYGRLNAANGSSVRIVLPEIPRGARYGTPVKTVRSDSYTLSPLRGNEITVTSTGIPKGVDNMSFTVPVIPDVNHNGYDITVTINVIRHDIQVSVTTERNRVLGVPLYFTTINAKSTETRITQVEYSLNGTSYSIGNLIITRSELKHFYFRVTTVMGYTTTRYNYEYKNGTITER